jgi:hypothetical protein
MDSHKMAGAGGAAARGAMEAGERGGGAAASRFSRGAGRGMGPCGFSQGEGGGRGRVLYAPESCRVGICGGSAVGRRATV